MGRRDSRTADLFSWEPPQVAVGYPQEVAGRGPLQNRIARLLSQALRDFCDQEGVSRDAVAGMISLELGRQVSRDMLDKWTSEAAGSHRIPLDAFIALIKVTEAEKLLGFVPDLFGFAVVPARYTAIIEMHLIEEKEAELAAAKARLAAKWRARS